MAIQVDVAEASAHLERLLDAAVAGEEVVIARAGAPLVTLVPVRPPTRRTLGFMPLELSDGLFDPLSDEEFGELHG